MSHHNHHHHGPRLRFCLRATVNALLAFGLAQVLPLPQHGLWAVLTAVVVIQMSIGGSLKAAAENIVGTIAGGVYASMVAALVPHSTPFAFAAVLAVVVAPLAYAAAVSASFRAAPVTAVLVLMISAQFGGTEIQLAFFRSLAVAVGGVVAIAVSLLVFPARAYALGLDEAVRVLQHMAQVLQAVMLGFRAPRDPLENVHVQDDIGEAVHAFAAIVGEAKSERLVHLALEPDPAALSRTLLRLRHDLVMLGRAAFAPLPDHLAARLGPVLTEIAERATDHLLASAGALRARNAPPPADNVGRALARYLSEIAVMRTEGLLDGLADGERERISGLGFVLRQLQQNLSELTDCLRDWARSPNETALSPRPCDASPLRRVRSMRECCDTHWRRLCRALRPDMSAEAPRGTIAASARACRKSAPGVLTDS